jgi:hypothetical protein
VLVDQHLDRQRLADMSAIVKGYAFALHLRDPALDMGLFHLEVGNAVT